MTKVNKKASVAHTEKKLDKTERLAGGYGVYAAKQSAYLQLRRCVLACMLGENIAYASGATVKEEIASLVPQVEPQLVAELAIEVRLEQKIRHAALFLAVEMTKHLAHRKLVGYVLKKIVNRPDEITDFLAMYWADGKKPIPAQVKKASSEFFSKWSDYHLSKYNRDNEIKLRDAMYLLHPKPSQGKIGRNKKWRKDQKELLGEEQFLEQLNDHEKYLYQLSEEKLSTPDTWEVALSSGKDKKTAWERLIQEGKLGALAYLRNLRNMRQSGVDLTTIWGGLSKVKSDWLLPLNFYAAYKECPEMQRPLDVLMTRCYELYPKLSGLTILIVDTSGSTHHMISEKSTLSRLDVEISLASMAISLSENVLLYATAGDDRRRQHSTCRVSPIAGLGLGSVIVKESVPLGGGGIFTRQCLEYIKEDIGGTVPDRIIVLSDSQDCDLPNLRLPKPFGKKNYLVDVSAHRLGIGYDGVWTAEISGVSDATIKYILEIEKEQN